MVILKFFLIFVTILLLVRFRAPLWSAVLAATLMTGILFQFHPLDFLSHCASALVGKSCIQLLLITYGLILMQNLMDDKNMLSNAEENIVALSSNPKIGSIAFPIVSGLLPSPAAVLMAGSTLKKRYENHLPTDTMAFIATYFRHVPEALFPVYTNVILICAVSQTPEWMFFLLMLPYTACNLIIPYWLYLRPLDNQIFDKNQLDKKQASYKKVFLNLWPVILMIIIILVFHLGIMESVYIVIGLFLILSYLKKQPTDTSHKPLPQSLKQAWNTNMMLLVASIMIFTEILSLSNAPVMLIEALEGFPIPIFFLYGIIILLGSIGSNLTAMIPVIFPLTLSIPHGHVALVILLASLGHLASQLCPTHICISLCADFFHISINDIFRKTLPVTCLMILASLLFYFLMLPLPW